MQYRLNPAPAQEGDAFSELLRLNVASELAEVSRTVMPFGRYRGRRLVEVPAEYLQSFAGKGWPKGRIGELMQIVYQMKADGSEAVFRLPPRGVRKRNSSR